MATRKLTKTSRGRRRAASKAGGVKIARKSTKSRTGAKKSTKSRSGAAKKTKRTVARKSTKSRRNTKRSRG